MDASTNGRDISDMDEKIDMDILLTILTFSLSLIVCSNFVKYVIVLQLSFDNRTVVIFQIALFLFANIMLNQAV